MDLVYHEFQPVYDENSKILILGSIPSVKSRELGFYYMHPQNRFWKIIAHLFDESVPDTIQGRKNMLLTHNIALWDVLKSCNIKGSADSTIKHAQTNNIAELIEKTKIKKVFLNGKTAFKYYDSFSNSKTLCEYYCLPSTSSANAACSFSELVTQWQCVRQTVRSSDK